MQNKGSYKPRKTSSIFYTNQLIKKQNAWWKHLLDVQAPYRWNLRQLKPGFTLDIGCGIGRNLIHLNGNGIGIDHNFNSVEVARKQGVTAFTPEEFESSLFNKSNKYDSLLLSHVAEHMAQQEVVETLRKYISLLKPQGKLIIITPQEAGFKSDSTHVEFMNFPKLRNIIGQLGCEIVKEYSFPFWRVTGFFFIGSIGSNMPMAS
jgi:2-polyprenyl-3-methyl-5-hydroxy-6-metoxy-1,4-benzoquinol methylase